MAGKPSPVSPLMIELTNYMAGALKRKLPAEVAERAKIHLVDTVAAIVRRRLTGRSIYAEDRGHMHHLMAGLGPVRRLAMVALLCSITAVGGVLAVVLQQSAFAVAATLLAVAASTVAKTPIEDFISLRSRGWIVHAPGTIRLMEESKDAVKLNVAGWPSDHFALGLMRNLKVFLSSEICQWVASPGMYSSETGCKPSRFSYTEEFNQAFQALTFGP